MADERYVFVVIAKKDRAVRVVPGEKLTWVLKPFVESGIISETATLLRQDKYFDA